MTYFADLSPCTYFSGKHPVLLAVGWLQHDREYPLGDPGQELYERLKKYQKGSWQPGIFRGGHRCDFCRYDGFYSHSNIVVPGRGVTYVAPEGILHYVGCHRYLPPRVLRGGAQFAVCRLTGILRASSRERMVAERCAPESDRTNMASAVSGGSDSYRAR